jgi:putative ABC transport system ATP-binding protein
MGEVPVRVLRDVTLDIYEDEVLVMAGPSGSGKTTLLNIIGGMDRPTQGNASYLDLDLTTASDRRLTAYRRDAIGFVFQFYNLVPTLTARENVMSAAEIAADPLDVDEVLRMVGLEERTEHFPSQLSGGEQQRVSIARALAKNPRILLCDEPTGALDFETGKIVLRLLVDLRNRYQKTVVIITHNTAIAAIADRVVHLRSGEVVGVERQDAPTPPEDIVW